MSTQLVTGGFSAACNAAVSVTTSIVRLTEAKRRLEPKKTFLVDRLPWEYGVSSKQSLYAKLLQWSKGGEQKNTQDSNRLQSGHRLTILASYGTDISHFPVMLDFPAEQRLIVAGCAGAAKKACYDHS